jgi:NAD+ kinase
MRIGVVSRPDRKQAAELVAQVVKFLESKGVEVIVETDTALMMDSPVESTDLGRIDADFIVTIGGDGTILRTAMLLNDPGIPILGVNMGSRGFLTEIFPNEVEAALESMLLGEYGVEECIKVASRSLDTDDTYPDALNEVLISSSMPSKMLDMRLSIDGVHILDIQADGAMVSTPTGSTAYNLSAGGPIVQTEVEAMVLTTICPYSYFRSMVVPLDSRITVELLKPKAEGIVIADGREYAPIKPLTAVEIWKSEHTTRFVRFKPFYERLERRLVFQKVR